MTHAASCEDGEERSSPQTSENRNAPARVGDPDGERAAAVMPILIRGASSDGEDGLGVDAGARDAPPEARRRTPWVAERENALVLNDHLDREAETRAPVKTRDGVRAREPLAKLERDGARHDVVDDGTKRVGLRRSEAGSGKRNPARIRSLPRDKSRMGLERQLCRRRGGHHSKLFVQFAFPVELSVRRSGIIQGTGLRNLFAWIRSCIGVVGRVNAFEKSASSLMRSCRAPENILSTPSRDECLRVGDFWRECWFHGNRNKFFFSHLCY